jgi:uncharacterized protein YkwD
MQVPSHRARRRQRAPLGSRPAFVAGLTVVVILIAASIYLLAGGSAPIRTDAIARPSTGPSCHGPGQPSAPCASAPAPSPGPATVSATPTRTASSHPAPRKPRVPKPTPAETPAAAPSPSGSAATSAAASVLDLINQARAQAGLPAYTILSGLQVSSAGHNQLMADGCGLSHQCPGEPALGDRETAAGVHWTAAGENIGEGGPMADTTAAITQMADALTQDMLNEKPPDDGHRLNLLSSTFTHVGIAIYRSSDGTVWMTQDFSN